MSESELLEAWENQHPTRRAKFATGRERRAFHAGIREGLIVGLLAGASGIAILFAVVLGVPI